ncbi:MAG: PqqD family protein [Deltaproteobacteria bacterium]|nr:PqqD family protein [Deltaproteobacteria bacterium]MBW2150735.1 PqqD family protein [Deltaproteobacteria bacterium]
MNQDPLSPKKRRNLDLKSLVKTCWGMEYPLRRPENTYRMYDGRIDIRNHFLPDRHEQLNETGSFILELCDGQHSMIEIWREVCEAFEVPDESAALGDVVRMIRYLQRFYVVYGSTIAGEQHLDVRHPRGVPTTTPVSY